MSNQENVPSSPKSLTNSDQSSNNDWQIVLPRRGRKKKTLPQFQNQEKRKEWSPQDQETDSIRESKLIQKIQLCINKLETSQFYQTLIKQLEEIPVFDSLITVLGSPDSKMGMVMYGIGSIENYENPRLQLSLAVLLKRKFSWVGSVEVFDPVFSVTECRVLESFGCSVLSVNEEGRRRAESSTMFFMPHCEAGLYDNLLQENWKVELLNHVVLFGNSFETYERFAAEFKSSSVVHSTKYIMASRKFCNEFKINTVSEDYFGAFHDSSWHFFSPVLDTELQFTSV